MSRETKQIGQYTCFKATTIKKVDAMDFRSMRRRNNDSKKAMEICDCMGFYEIIHNESHIKETKECLGKISVNIDYYEPKNKEYIYPYIHRDNNVQ